MVHRVGIAVKPVVQVMLQGIKTFEGRTLKSGDFTFDLIVQNGAPVNLTRVTNAANGSFSFGTIPYEVPGTYTYQIVEDHSDPMPGIIYDFHTATVTVIVTEDADGSLSAVVTYDNSTSTTESDRAMTDKAAFTNVAGYELPNTGGDGTTSYTIGGLLLIIAAAILLYSITSKRRKEERPSF